MTPLGLQECIDKEEEDEADSTNGRNDDKGDSANGDAANREDDSGDDANYEKD